VAVIIGQASKVLLIARNYVMSLGARIAIGLAALLAAAGFLKSALHPAGMPAGSLGFYGMAVFCVIIAMACFFPKGHPLTLRIIGTAIFLAYIAYVSDSWHTRNMMRAIQGFLIWGLPSGYLAIMGKYPFWGRGAAGFNANQLRSKGK
jgi:hypothetical protein